MHFSADYHHSRWTVGFMWNGADFYDLFGPRNTAARRDAYVNYDLPLIFDPPETMNFTAKVAYLRRSRRAAGFQNVPSPLRIFPLRKPASSHRHALLARRRRRGDRKLVHRGTPTVRSARCPESLRAIRHRFALPSIIPRSA